jgi:hypothetical protein
MSKFLSIAICAASFVAVGCGGSANGPGLDAAQVRPALAKLPYRYQLREIDFPGTKTEFVGTAHAANGTHVDFAVSICDQRQCPDPPVPDVPGASTHAAVVGTGWAFLDNGTARTPGQTLKQGLAVGQDTFLALCHAADEPQCY